MPTRTYAQYCGLAHALELVGERWALLVIRDLIRSPKRFTDLRRGLPRIPTNVLSTRLKELEEAGIVRRRVLPRPQSSVVYELTEYGRELEDVLVSLLLWGAKSLGAPRAEDTISSESLLLALRAMFRPEAARGHTAGYELRVGGTVTYVRVQDGRLHFDDGPLPGADLTIEADLGLRPLLTGEITPGEAIRTGVVRVTGDPALLARFVELFSLP